MTRAFVGAAFAVALLGSVAYAADATPPASGTPAPAATDSSTPPTPPASLHCKAPKVPTMTTVKGKVKWSCKVPPATPAPAPQ